MSRIKMKSSTSFLKREKSNWKPHLQQLDLNTIREDRVVELVILNECLPKYFDDILKFQKQAYLYTTQDVKPIIYEEILYIITHYPGWNRPYIDIHTEMMIKEACTEARSYLKVKKPIPLELTASLIKLRAIMLIQEDAYNEKMLKMNLMSNTVSTHTLDSCETCSNVSDKETENLVDEKGQPKIDLQFTESNTGQNDYTDEYIHEYDTVDVFFSSCSITLREYIRTLKRTREQVTGARRSSVSFTPITHNEVVWIRKKEQFRTLWSIRHCKWLQNKKEKSVIMTHTNTETEKKKLLYLVLTGFYDPSLIISLHNISVPIRCVLSIAMKDDRPIDPTQPFNMNTFRLGSPDGVVPVYHYSLQCLYTQSRVAVKVCDLNYQQMKDQLVYHFWNTIDELFESNYEIMKDIICVMCPPVDYKGRYVKPQSAEYNEQAVKIFHNIQELLYKLPFFRKWYGNYMDSIYVLDLGSTPEHISTSEMFYYNEVLDKVPSSCYSIGLMIEGLLAEVEHKNMKEENYYHTPSKIKFEFAAKRRKYDKLLKIRRLCYRLFNKYHFKYVPSNFELFYQKYRSSFLLPKEKPCKPGRFEIAEGDILKLRTMYYPSLEKKMYNNLCDFKKGLPISLRKLYDNMCKKKTESVLDSNQYHTWSSLLRLSPEEINERLQVYMFKLLKCEDQKKSKPYSQLYNYFPDAIRLDHTVLINREDSPRIAKSSQNAYDDYNETFFQWQEHLEPSIFLQKLDKCKCYFKCMDYEYIPFLDSIILRFHDKCDNFGIATESWTKSFRSLVSMHDFFKSVIFEDPFALCCSWDNTTNIMSRTKVQKLPSNMNDSLRDYTASFTANNEVILPSRSKELHTTCFTPYLLNAYNLNRRLEVTAVSTVFRSLDGFKVTVEKMLMFNLHPYLKLQLEADHHTALMHIQQYKNTFSFYIEASNGARIAFAKAEANKNSDPADSLIAKKPRFEKEHYYTIKEIKTVGFGERLCLHEMHFVNEISLLKILDEYFPFENASSTETLQLLDFKKSVILKSTASLTDVRTRNDVPKMYLDLMKAIRRIKRRAIPHFKIISTALHKHKYVKIAPLKIRICFLDGEKTLKYIPNLNTKKKIEITKCIPLKMKPKDSFYQLEKSSVTFEPPNIQSYDCRLSLPNGLQVASEPSLERGVFNIVQYYVPNNPNFPDEISRTFTNNGFIQIRYRDGSIKMIGVQGRSVVGELPCKPTVKHREKKSRNVKCATREDEIIKKFTRLQKSVFRKVYRYQSKFIHTHVNNLLRNKKKLKEVDIGEFKKIRNSVIGNDSVIGDQLSAAMDFYVSEESFRDYYTLDTATSDSHSSINDDGELITIFADGTKITSWFLIDQEMIMLDEFDNVDLYEMDIDDYTCNFLIPRVGGWISVQLCYQYEHPQYATVAFNNRKEIHIRLPEVEYQARFDGTFFVNVKDEMYSHITGDSIKFSTNYCKTCYQYCETKINTKYLFSEEADIKDDEILLEAKDTFNKVFTVDHKGVCYRNDSYHSGDTKIDCKNHKIADTQKFFIFDKDLKGKMFWNRNKVQSKLIDTQHCKTLKERSYFDESGNLKVYDFVKYYDVHYTDRFLMEYRHPNPPIFEYKVIRQLPRIAYTSKRQISLIPDYTQVLPLFTLIQELRVKYPSELPLPKFENIFQLEKYLNPKALQIKTSSTDTIHMKLSPVFAEVVVENFMNLMKKIEKFEITANENITYFEKNLEESTDNKSSSISLEGSEAYMSDIIKPKVHVPKIYKKAPHEKNKSTTAFQKPGKVTDTRIKRLEPPPVPKNSHISIGFDQASQVGMQEQKAISHSDLIKKIDNLLMEQTKTVLQEQFEGTDQEKESEFKQIIELRKPISTIDSDSSTTLSLKDVVKKVNLNTRDKKVCTTTPFDLFSNECHLPQNQEVLKIHPSRSHKVQRKKVLNQEPLWQQFDAYGKGTKKSDMLKLESKHSKVMTGVQAIESYNQIYGKCISLHKDIPKDMKRFTELQRAAERQNLKRTSSITELKEEDSLLPLILSPEKKSTVHHTTIDEDFRLASIDSEKGGQITRTITPITNVEKDGVQSKTLKRLSHEFVGIKRSLRYVPPEIDKKIQSKFLSRKEIGHVSYDISASNVDTASCQYIEKDCLCPAYHRSLSKHDCSDVKNFRKLSKCSNKSPNKYQNIE